MPLYELSEGALTPFARLRPGAELYEKEIEDLVWGDLEAFTGEALFPVARQPRISAGGIPDVLALDERGRVVVIEVKRDVDRSQLAQCLEYAGWARLTNLDEIAGLYDSGTPGRLGVEAFFQDWAEFTDTATPVTISPQPRLFLVARDFEGRTRSALDFLQENALPVTVVPVTVYQDATGRRVVDIEAEHEPDLVLPTGRVDQTRRQVMVNGRRVGVADLIDAGLLEAGERVEFVRPRRGEHHTATIGADGSFTLDDGTVWRSPSKAAQKAADMVACDGWHAWRVPRVDGVLLASLRRRYIESTRS